VTSTVGKILVVDDHVDLAENIAEVLAGAGYETMVAASAEAALARMESEPVVALITDYRLPGRNGAELIRELRRRGNDIPVLVMSAFTDEDTIESARSAGAVDVLAKPVELERLISLVASLQAGGGLVLVVEDNRDLAENLAEILRGRGHEVVVSVSVAEALSACPSPSAAVIDFRLPDGTGIDVAERLTARDPRVAILFMSGHGDALRAGLPRRFAETAQLEKPVDVGRLLAWVSAAVKNGPALRPHR
jgi:DNA-binding NtrC family response regulator